MIFGIGLFAKDKQSSLGCTVCEPGAGSQEVLITGIVLAPANKQLECRAVILLSGTLLLMFTVIYP